MIGILDWGIGGLDLFRRLQILSARTPVIYVSDSGYEPYGKVPAALLVARIQELGSVFRALGATRLVVACNAASSVLPDLGIPNTSGRLATPRGALEVTGVIAHAVRLARRRSNGVLGVIGGQRTVRSGLYRRALARPGVRLIQRVAQPLSARVEAGDLDSPALRRELARIVQPLRRAARVLLACTHYPALIPHFQANLPDAELLDPAAPLSRWVATRWGSVNSPSTYAPQASRFFTTGDAGSMRRAAERAWGVKLDRIEPLAMKGTGWDGRRRA